MAAMAGKSAVTAGRMSGASGIGSGDARQPRFDSGGVDIDFQCCRLDAIDMPATAEALADFGLGDAARAEIAGLVFTEAHHEVASANSGHRFQALDVGRPVGIAEDVEKAHIEDGVELLAKGIELERIVYQEADVQAPLPGFPLGDFDGGGRAIDAGGFETAMSSHQCVLAGTAADIEDAASEFAG